MPFLLTPEQKQTAFWLAIWLGVVLLLVALGPVLTPFLAAAILAYTLEGAVDYLEGRRIVRWRIPRTFAVVIVISLFIGMVAALVLIVVPVLQKEIPLLQAQIPAFFQWLDQTLTPRLQSMGVDLRLDSSGLRDMVAARMATDGDAIWSTLLASARIGGSAVLAILAQMLLIPVVLFYLLLEWHQLLARIELAIPRRWAARTVELAKEADGLLAQYLRGQILVMLVLAAYYSAALAIAGLDVALPVGILTGLLVFIPYLGFGLGLALALIAAVLQFQGWEGLAIVGAIYGFGQVLESFVLTPRMVGERIGLHPLAVIFALLAFGELFGFAGVLLALPASAVLMVAFRHLAAHYLRSSFYNA
jgi:predicted PurR-regulated permease PerM